MFIISCVLCKRAHPSFFLPISCNWPFSNRCSPQLGSTQLNSVCDQGMKKKAAKVFFLALSFRAPFFIPGPFSRYAAYMYTHTKFLYMQKLCYTFCTFHSFPRFHFIMHEPMISSMIVVTFVWSGEKGCEVCLLYTEGKKCHVPFQGGKWKLDGRKL